MGLRKEYLTQTPEIIFHEWKRRTVIDSKRKCGRQSTLLSLGAKLMGLGHQSEPLALWQAQEH